MTLFNTSTLHAVLWRRGMTLASRAERPGFETHRTLCGIGYFFFIDTVCCIFLLSRILVFFCFFEKSVRARCLFLFFRVSIVFQGVYMRNFNRKYTKEKCYCEKGISVPMRLVKVSCSVISESWKISKSLLVTITKLTMKSHNVQRKIEVPRDVRDSKGPYT